jgi:hypothetical protein
MQRSMPETFDCFIVATAGPLPFIRATRSTIGEFVKHVAIKPTQRTAWRKGFVNPDGRAEASYENIEPSVLVPVVTFV